MMPVAMMIHGAGGGGWEWDLWRPVFERAGYEVVAKDLQPSPSGLAQTTFADYVRQVSAWIPRNRPYVLVGASMGGPLVLKAAENRHPLAVVLVNPVPPAGTGSKLFPPVVKWADGPLSDSESAMPDSTPEMIRKAWKRWRDESGQVMTALSKGVPVKKPGAPVLVIIGESDTDVPPSKSAALAAEFHADVFRYPGMSHVGPLLGKQAPEVADAVVNWLKEKTRTHTNKG